MLDNVTPYAVGAHKHAPEIAQLLGFPVTFVPHVVPLRRGLVCTCYVTASEDPRPLLEAAYAESHVVEVIDAVPDLARLQGTDAAEVAAFEDASTGRWIVICRDRQPRQGRRRPGRPEREPRARPRRDRRPPPLAECSSDGRRSRAHRPRVTGAVTAAKGFVAGAVHAGIRKSKLDLAVVRSTVPPSAPGCSPPTASRPRPCSSRRRTSRSAEPQAVVINSGVANAATGKQGELDALATAAETARAARASTRTRCSSSPPA